jgi:DNA-binding FadR family transcriptional regulator
MDRLVEQIDGAAEHGAGVPAAARLKDFLAGAAVSADGRLPPERELASRLGVTRSDLRKALAELEADGVIWRHVGKGTFVGARPVDTVADVAALTRRTNPSEVMQARLTIEPEMARLAALHATSADIAELRSCIARSRQAETWRQYEAWDNRFHRAVGEATGNALLLGLLDTLTAVRRAVTWGRLRYNPVKPDPAHHSFDEHEAIVAAIADRDAAAAAAAMRTHIRSVERNLLARMDRGVD